jgi:hypothetical protein
LRHSLGAVEERRVTARGTLERKIDFKERGVKHAEEVSQR